MDQLPPNALHLLRAILRECTYLPDQHARSYIHKYALTRYRAYQNIKDLSASRRTHVLQKARKGLSILRRANDGYLNPLHKVLWTAYGRIGRRRRQLMAEIMTPQVEENPSAVGTLELAPKYDRQWKPSDIFTALLASQVGRKGQFDRKIGKKASRNLKKEPDIPENNKWRRPMPMKRVRNMTRRWYAKCAEALLPPLPDHEWEHLRRLAWGEMSCLGSKPRRKPAKNTQEESRHVLNDDVLVIGPPKDKEYRLSTNNRPHHITPRFMQRTYSLIFMHVPVVTWDEVRKNWAIKWGSKPEPVGFRHASELQKDLFFGDQGDEAFS